jgi:hypothetical protein
MRYPEEWQLPRRFRLRVLVVWGFALGRGLVVTIRVCLDTFPGSCLAPRRRVLSLTEEGWRLAR